MEEQKCDGLKKKFIVVRKRKAVSTDKTTTLDQPKKKRYRVVVKQKNEPIPVEKVEVEVEKEPEIKPVQVEITVPKKTRTRKAHGVKVEIKTDDEVIISEEKLKTKRARKTSLKSEENKKMVPIYDPDPFLETEVSALNIARCLRKLKDIVKGKINF